MTSAILRWQQRVTAHRDQTLRIQHQTSWEPADFWGPFKSRFKADPQRTGGPVLNRLRREVTPEATVLDVGGGAGRFALPLALSCGHVTAVEPSAIMVQWLQEGAREFGVSNLSVIQESWENANVDPQDLVLCAYVLHGVKEIEPFIRKLAAHSKQGVLILEHMESPDLLVAPVWSAVHGEERADTPGFPGLLEVLWEMDIYPNVEMFETTAPESVRSREEALQALRHFLFVRPGTEQDRELQAVMDELIIETHDGFTVRGAAPRRQALITWNV